MNKTRIGTTTKGTSVPTKAPTSMHINSEFVSNEIDESDLQDEKHSEQGIRT
jgi:hypothetical protein